MVGERGEVTITPPEQELKDLLKVTGQRTKDLLTKIMSQNTHLFRNTGSWDTGVILGGDTPNKRFESKPIIELDFLDEASLESYFLTEEGIFISHHREVDEGGGFYPVWDQPEEIPIEDYVRHATRALDEIIDRQKRFGKL